MTVAFISKSGPEPTDCIAYAKKLREWNKTYSPEQVVAVTGLAEVR